MGMGLIASILTTIGIYVLNPKEEIIIPEMNVTSVEQFNITANGKIWNCIVEDKVTSYTKCYSGIYEGYLGELI